MARGVLGGCCLGAREAEEVLREDEIGKPDTKRCMTTLDGSGTFTER